MLSIFFWCAFRYLTDYRFSKQIKIQFISNHIATTVRTSGSSVQKNLKCNNFLLSYQLFIIYTILSFSLHNTSRTQRCSPNKNPTGPCWSRKFCWTKQGQILLDHRIEKINIIDPTKNCWDQQTIIQNMPRKQFCFPNKIPIGPYLKRKIRKLKNKIVLIQQIILWIRKYSYRIRLESYIVLPTKFLLDHI